MPKKYFFQLRKTNCFEQLEESTTSSIGNSRPTSSLSSFRTETTTKSDKLKLSHRKEGNVRIIKIIYFFVLKLFIKTTPLASVSKLIK